MHQRKMFQISFKFQAWGLLGYRGVQGLRFPYYWKLHERKVLPQRHSGPQVRHKRLTKRQVTMSVLSFRDQWMQCAWAQGQHVWESSRAATRASSLGGITTLQQHSKEAEDVECAGSYALTRQRGMAASSVLLFLQDGDSPPWPASS